MQVSKLFLMNLLSALADEIPGVANKYVEGMSEQLSRSVRYVYALMREGKITMLYKVRPGPCPSSFGAFNSQ